MVASAKFIESGDLETLSRNCAVLDKIDGGRFVRLFGPADVVSYSSSKDLSFLTGGTILENPGK